MPMARARRVMPFLQRRQATWYFRFKLPRRLRSFAGRSEIRVSLGTTELWVARQKAERVLPDIYSIKVLARHMSALEPAHLQKALDLAFSRIVGELERTKEPWMRSRVSDPWALPGVDRVPRVPGMLDSNPSELMRDLELGILHRSI